MKVGELFLGLELQRTSFDASLAAVKGEWGEFGKTLASGALVAGGAALAGLAAGLVESAHKAADFQQAMEMIRTQAGASQAEVDAMKGAVLGLAGQVSTSPLVLAEAMYHIESTGFRGAEALDALRIAAEGAKVGNANLTDVTNALDAVLVAGVPEAKNMAGAMGELNAIVGAGDMTMQDLADAMGTGVLAKAKVFGLGLQDVGAALAVLGDNNIRGSDAATKLGMSFALLSAQKAPAIKALSEIGIKTDQLGNDMRKGGLVLALQDLQDHLTKSGKTAQQQGDILSAAFGGGKSAGTIELLLQQLPRLKDKFGEVGKGATGFGDAWAATQQNVNTKLDGLKAAADAAGIKLGIVLLPYVSDLLDKVTPLVPKFADWATDLTTKLVPALSDMSKFFQKGEFADGLANLIDEVAGPKGASWSQTVYAVRDAMQTMAPYVGIITASWVAWNVALAVTKGLAMVAVLWEFVGVLAAVTAGENVLTVAQVALDLAMDANPIGVVVIAIAALATGFTLAYQNIKPFRDFINGLFDDLKKLIDYINKNWDRLTGGADYAHKHGVQGAVDRPGYGPVNQGGTGNGAGGAQGAKPRPGYGGAAGGGSFDAGSWSWVGEQGPELVRFGSSATVFPNRQTGGGVNVHVHVAGSVTSERDLVLAIRDGIRRADRAVR